jgi:hypothetical protein
LWVPEISLSYIRYRDGFFTADSGSVLTTDKEKKPKKIKKTNRMMSTRKESQEIMEDVKRPVMAEINDNGGRPHCNTKRPKKSCFGYVFVYVFCLLFDITPIMIV